MGDINSVRLRNGVQGLLSSEGGGNSFYISRMVTHGLAGIELGTVRSLKLSNAEPG